MKVLWTKNTDITNYVSSIEWGGSKSQVARKLTIKVANAPYDTNVTPLNIPLGDKLYLFSDDGKTEYFTGFVTERERSSKSGEITYTAYDLLFYTIKSSGTYNFRGKTAETITKVVCDDFKIPVGSLMSTGITQKLIAKDKKIYDIIMAAYTQAHNHTGKHYQVRAKSGKLTVIEYGSTICTYMLTDSTNISQSQYKESLDKMINKVRIYDGNGKQIGVVENAGDQKKYGIFQSTYTKSKDKNATAEAKAKLASVEKTATIQACGDHMMDAIAGNGVYIQDSATGLVGLFWIDQDTHKWSKGVHTMTLSLEFKKMMDIKEV